EIPFRTFFLHSVKSLSTKNYVCAMKSGDLYLLGYNTVQYFGWGYILVSTALGLANGRPFPELYKNVELQLKIFQTAAILEIVHSLVGLVRSPVFTTVVQVFSRVTVLWLILDTIETSRVSVGVPMLLLAWSITEVVRYSFYALNLLNSVPYALTWMRYTFFIALYPMGAGGEVLTMIAALDEIARRKHFTIEMPNSWNMSFNFYYVVIALCLIYLPGFPKLYGYTFFIALYPMGAGGEVLTMIAALDEIARRKHFTIEMPNSWNMSFNFYYVVIALCLIYLPGFPKLYGYMFVQRKKVLGGRGKNAAEQSKKVE
uniref:Very-long-chain (3R)-3-hydroxyacyl-CoA dehydratase n=1 Tax=Globodera pallida TaxID=36090 RepID=A0A183C0U8_GLOPA